MLQFGNIVIKKIIECKAIDGYIRITVKASDEKFYDINYRLGDLSDLSFMIEHNKSFLNVPVDKIDIQINKEHTIDHVIEDIVTHLFFHRNDDFYIVMSSKTLYFIKTRDFIPGGKKCDIYNNYYNGHTILIDDSLQFGEVVFR